MKTQNSVPMIRQSLDVIKSAVQHVNLGQVPAVIFEQPLFALAKQIQLCWPNLYGEQFFVIMLGGLHIEMVLWKCLGWLADSG